MMNRTFLAAAVLAFAATGCAFSANGRIPVFAGGRVSVGGPVLVAQPAPVSVSVAAPSVAVQAEPAVAVQAAPVAGPEVNCSIEAGPLWSNDHAQRDCHGVCQRAGAVRFTGQWWTTRWAEMSVCQCAFPAGAVCPAVDDRPHEQR